MPGLGLCQLYSDRFPLECRSRRHFLILRDRSGQYLLQDVGSTTGTFLMVREELPLDHQMIIQPLEQEMSLW